MDIDNHVFGPAFYGHSKDKLTAYMAITDNPGRPAIFVNESLLSLYCCKTVSSRARR
jgi:hypothetical protein